ncbi:MAG: 4Fe-4S dicluster domain-containing protein [Dehalococcoidia bacterium]|nr:4Fe-4S dicluster domain-containing protein [Dehalococcoidia bacterium]
MQYGFYVNQTRCTGCFTCVVACRDWHDVPAGPASWIRVKTIEKGRYPDVFVAFLPVTCYHCRQPACVDACPAGAISKRDQDGVVTVDRELCLGSDKCQLCLEACPYDAPQFGPEQDATMQKCDLCLDRLAKGGKPVCVDACPMWALDAGPLEELEAKYGDVTDAEGFEYDAELGPSVIYKAKRDVKGLPTKKVFVTPRR